MSRNRLKARALNPDFDEYYLADNKGIEVKTKEATIVISSKYVLIIRLENLILLFQPLTVSLASKETFDG